MICFSGSSVESKCSYHTNDYQGDLLVILSLSKYSALAQYTKMQCKPIEYISYNEVTKRTIYE